MVVIVNAVGISAWSYPFHMLHQGLAPKSASSALFADKSTLYTMGKSVPELSESLNKVLTEVQSWMVDNKSRLTFNVKKKKCMLFLLCNYSTVMLR